mmetsp:Transcript_36557/g.94380  ORF Transcript_36557/g.94380 Transcript_36557/m.94380 type:complete len:391 (+) Transcript_36557:984-2156(+)
MPRNARPVEVVADVEEVVRVACLRPDLHLLRNALLGLVVDAVHEVALAARELLGVAVVGRLHYGALDDAAPVADDEDGVHARAHEADVRHRDAVQVVGPLAGLRSHERVRALRAVARVFGVAARVLQVPLLERVVLVTVRQVESAVLLCRVWRQQAHLDLQVPDQAGLLAVVPLLAGAPGVAPRHVHIAVGHVPVHGAEADAVVALQRAARRVILPELVRVLHQAVPEVDAAFWFAAILRVQADAVLPVLDRAALRRLEVPLLVLVPSLAIPDLDLAADLRRHVHVQAHALAVGRRARAPVVEPGLLRVHRIAGPEGNLGARAGDGGQALAATGWSDRAVGTVVIPMLISVLLAACHVHVAVLVHGHADAVAVLGRPRVQLLRQAHLEVM